MARITFKNKDSIAILKIKGELINPREEFHEPIKHYLEEYKNNKTIPKIIVDLEKVPNMNASGLGALISLHTGIKQLEGSMILVNLSEKVKSLLTITKLITVFTIASMEEALKK
ncbi:MAG: STAS domain-containing protein [Candidatus Kerfeldbacteria bacterium]|nr:STAS domain-containing protein [Candidatus Kerfeldbacteria bacterium]